MTLLWLLRLSPMGHCQKPFKGVLSSYQTPQSCSGTYFRRKASPKPTYKNTKLMPTQEPLIMTFHFRGACSPLGAPALHSAMAPLPSPSLLLDFSIPLPKSWLCMCGGETSQTSHNPQLVFQNTRAFTLTIKTLLLQETASNPTWSSKAARLVAASWRGRQCILLLSLRKHRMYHKG